mmetsp:Transcript_14068/g.50045  ORF Transcript_14068/g.50045 Transcript_14068/m.50045 type:complete len:86 (+) Transcript_14068:433-690(+)
MVHSTAHCSGAAASGGRGVQRDARSAAGPENRAARRASAARAQADFCARADCVVHAVLASPGIDACTHFFERESRSTADPESHVS